MPSYDYDSVRRGINVDNNNVFEHSFGVRGVTTVHVCTINSIWIICLNEISEDH